MDTIVSKTPPLTRKSLREIGKIVMGYVLYVLAMVVSLLAGIIGGNPYLTLIGATLMVNGALTLVWEEMKQ